MPDHRLERFGMRCDTLLRRSGNHDDDVAGLFRIAAVASDDAEHACVARLRFLHRRDDIGADIAFEIAAADRENQDGIARSDAADPQPSTNTLGQPSSLVRAESSETLSVGA